MDQNVSVQTIRRTKKKRKSITLSDEKIKKRIRSCQRNAQCSDVKPSQISKISESAYKCFDGVVTYFVDQLSKQLDENAKKDGRKSIEGVHVKKAYNDFISSIKIHPNFTKFD